MWKGGYWFHRDSWMDLQSMHGSKGWVIGGIRTFTGKFKFLKFTWLNYQKYASNPPPPGKITGFTCERLLQDPTFIKICWIFCRAEISIEIKWICLSVGSWNNINHQENEFAGLWIFVDTDWGTSSVRFTLHLIEMNGGNSACFLSRFYPRLIYWALINPNNPWFGSQ